MGSTNRTIARLLPFHVDFGSQNHENVVQDLGQNQQLAVHVVRFRGILWERAIIGPTRPYAPVEGGASWW